MTLALHLRRGATSPQLSPSSSTSMISLDIDTPFIPPTLLPQFFQWMDDQLAGRPTPWYRDFEDLVKQVDMCEWERMFLRAKDLMRDYFLLKEWIVDAPPPYAGDDEKESKWAEEQRSHARDLLVRLTRTAYYHARGPLRESSALSNDLVAR